MKHTGTFATGPAATGPATGAAAVSATRAAVRPLSAGSSISPVSTFLSVHAPLGACAAYAMPPVTAAAATTVVPMITIRRVEMRRFTAMSRPFRAPECLRDYPVDIHTPSSA